MYIWKKQPCRHLEEGRRCSSCGAVVLAGHSPVAHGQCVVMNSMRGHRGIYSVASAYVLWGAAAQTGAGFLGRTVAVCYWRTVPCDRNSGAVCETVSYGRDLIVQQRKGVKRKEIFFILFSHAVLLGRGSEKAAWRTVIPMSCSNNFIRKKKKKKITLEERD